MMEARLQNRLGALEHQLRQARLWRRLMYCWAVTAGAELLLFLIRSFTSLDPRPWWWLVLAGGLISAAVVWRRERRRAADFRALVAAIERENPDTRHLLLTSLEQEPNSQSGEFGYLQLRVIEEALAHPHAILWQQQIERKSSSARNAQWLALAALLVVLSFGNNIKATRWRLNQASLGGKEIEVTPGDTQIERGSGLVVSARFGGTPPAEASLVLNSASGKTQRLPMARNLADPVFGVSLLEVMEDGLYRVEAGGKKSRDYKISVFEFPALTRADAELQFPAYTGLTNKTIPDTRRVSAVEGTRLTYSMQLNKPVTRAWLVGKDQTLILGLQPNAIATLNAFTLTNSARYKLELVDAEGRTNRAPAEFVIQVLPNLPPEVKIAFPRGDQRVSRLEEMDLQGEARGEFGLLSYGLGFGVAGQEPQLIKLGQSAPAGQTRQFTNQLALEKLGVEVDQLVSYFAWADDHGPDGQVRRTFSDIFFAEVRPFEEIFRADQSGASASERGNQPGSQGGDQGQQLAELEKQIVIATWKLQRTRAVTAKESKP
ncbi:MAG TPA: hypothetical protein VL970_15090 [Candidatus Acidoferrales bacterium]|nr:hypothetical protein [Candidatus Acidoferrales bacterium]